MIQSRIRANRVSYSVNVRWTLIVPVLFLGCAGEAKEPTERPLEASLHCPAELECRLFGDCQSGTDPVATCAANKCTDDPPTSVCLVTHCLPELTQCYFTTADGTPQCADLWRCYGDCGDDENCLQHCRSDVSTDAKALFLTAELCTDAHVITQCDKPGPACDRAAVESCRDALIACVDHHNTTPPAWLESECEKSADPPACTKQNLRILAACPTADATAWDAYMACSANKSSCPEPTLSHICKEIQLL
jgi:hypothetical protein